jgi:hypothetical protein
MVNTKAKSKELLQRLTQFLIDAKYFVYKISLGFAFNTNPPVVME